MTAPGEGRASAPLSQPPNHPLGRQLGRLLGRRPRRARSVASVLTPEHPALGPQALQPLTEQHPAAAWPVPPGALPLWPSQQWQPPPHRRACAGRWVIGAAVLAVLVADGVSSVVVHPHRAVPAVPGAGSLAAAVPSLEAFDAQDRGLRYLKPVKVIVMSATALQAFVIANSAGGQHLDDATNQTYQALGLIDSWQAYSQHAKVFDSEDVAGLYVDGTNTIRIAAEKSNPYTRSVLAHELTHALDDQHFGLSRTEDTAVGQPHGNTPPTDAFGGYPLPDVVTGVKGLIEGDAEHTRDDYLAQLSPSERAAEQREEQAAGGSIMANRDDRTIFPLDYLPYSNGVSFVQALLDHGGEQALDAAFADPPTTTAQILHPQIYLASAAGAGGAVRVSSVPGVVRGTETGSGRLGEAGLALVLYGGGQEQVTDGAASAWRGDAFTVSTDGADACVAWALELDTTAHASAIAAQLQTRLPNASVDATDAAVSLTSCR